MRGIRIDYVKCLRFYYELHELGNKEVMEMFNIGPSKAGQMKRDAQVEQRKRNVMFFNPVCVNTEVAFDVWGIDIADVEKRVAKLKKLGMLEAM